MKLWHDKQWKNMMHYLHVSAEDVIGVGYQV